MHALGPVKLQQMALFHPVFLHLAANLGLPILKQRGKASFPFPLSSQEIFRPDMNGSSFLDTAASKYNNLSSCHYLVG